MDGLVSTGNKIPITILKIIFPTKKNFPINFMHIFDIQLVDISQPDLLVTATFRNSGFPGTVLVLFYLFKSCAIFLN